MEESGAVNDAPLGDFLYNMALPLLPIKRKYVISAVDINSGTVVKFTEKTTTDHHKMVKEALSSSSISLIFPT